MLERLGTFFFFFYPRAQDEAGPGRPSRPQTRVRVWWWTMRLWWDRARSVSDLCVHRRRSGGVGPIEEVTLLGSPNHSGCNHTDVSGEESRLALRFDLTVRAIGVALTDALRALEETNGRGGGDARSSGEHDRDRSKDVREQPVIGDSGFRGRGRGGHSGLHSSTFWRDVSISEGYVA